MDSSSWCHWQLTTVVGGPPGQGISPWDRWSQPPILYTSQPATHQSAHGAPQDLNRSVHEGTFAGRAPGAPGIQINGPAIYPNALPPNITPSSSPGYLTPAVSGAHVWAEWPCHPCLCGAPNTGDKKHLGENRGKLCPARPACARCANILSIMLNCATVSPSALAPPSKWSHFTCLCTPNGA